jgi:hypothetical protein
MDNISPIGIVTSNPLPYNGYTLIKIYNKKEENQQYMLTTIPEERKIFKKRK